MLIKKKYLHIIYFIAAIMIYVVVWYLLVLIYPSPLFPLPHEVLYYFLVLIIRENLLYHILVTFYRVFIGFLLGVLLGFIIGFISLISRIFKNLIYPLVAFIVATPSFTFIPLLMLWIGLNDLLPIIAVVICTGFPLIYAVISSVKIIDQEIINVALSLGAKPYVVIFKIILPLSITHIASLLKFEVIHSWRIVFVAEYLGLTTGLGYLMAYAYSTIRVEEIIALIIVIGILSLISQYFIEYIESIITRKWGVGWGRIEEW